MNINILLDLIHQNGESRDVRFQILSPLEVEAIKEVIEMSKRLDDLYRRIYDKEPG